MSIRVLDAATIGRIAAGEVVERPTSVIKELVENALDAGSTSITIEVMDGGASFMRVTDNGCGIASNEVRMAFENHATSKITNAEDLGDIRTLGFRGEALSSIASVSKIELITRQRGAAFGVQMKLVGTEVQGFQEIGCAEGTTIIVRDLFFNTPARRGFLKKARYEAGLITELVARLMLGNPDVSIRFILNAKTHYQSMGDGQILHTAFAVYGREVAEGMSLIDESAGGLRIHGLIGVGDCERNNRSHQSFFINGRLVRCELLTRALEDACKGRVMASMHPMCALNVCLPPDSVDINVHPNKLEVRFRDEASVRMSLDELFERALNGDGMLNPLKYTEKIPPVYQRPEIEFNEGDKKKVNKTEVGDEQTEVQYKQTKVPSINDEPEEAEQIKQIVQSFPAKESTDLRESHAPAPLTVSKPEAVKKIPEAPRVPELGGDVPFKIHCVVFNTYVIVEIQDKILFIDQHAAHERLLYEKYKVMLEHNNAAQQLLTPLVIRVSKREMDLLIDNQSLLGEIGYEYEPFGESDIRMRAVPFVLGQADLQPQFMSMLEELDQLKAATLERRRNDIIRFACKRAVKSGDHLTQGELESLIQEMLYSNAPPTCPHGRPVVRTCTRSEIDRLFKR